MRQISRDPFARETLCRESAGPGRCQWCGQFRRPVYQYFLDQDTGRRNDISGVFCSVQCMRDYS